MTASVRGAFGPALGQESGQNPRLVDPCSNFARKIARALAIVGTFDRAASWPVGQVLTRQPRHISLFITALVACAAAGCSSPKSSEAVRVGHAVPRGGELSVSIRAE